VSQEGTRFSDRAARWAVGGWAVAAAIAGCALAAAPARPTTTCGPRWRRARPRAPGPGRRETGWRSAPTASARTRPAGDGLAVRSLRVRPPPAAAAARHDGVAVSFVPRPGSRVAEVRLLSLRDGVRRPVARRVVAVRAGRRLVLQLPAPGLRAGRYEVAVRAGASLRTLGAPVVAGLRVV
jgi:hypothetical protein